jgi:glycosyltransferase involved in cell wall biosynthesis
VLAASWIDEANILGGSEAAEGWRKKLADPSRPPRLSFAGRLIPSKGILELLHAMDRVRERGIRAELDIYGFGELESRCRDAADRSGGAIRFRGSLPYGPSFFEALRACDVLVVPTLSDEQPRVVFDAFSQAIPVLASDTMGHRQCVEDGRTGMLFTAGDADAIAAVIQRASADRQKLAEMGLAALAVARSNTHAAMHRRRFELIKRAIAERAPP